MFSYYFSLGLSNSTQISATRGLVSTDSNYNMEPRLVCFPWTIVPKNQKRFSCLGRIC